MAKLRVVVAAIAVLMLAAYAQPASAQDGGRAAVTGGLAWFSGDVEESTTWIVGLQYAFPTMTPAGSRGNFVLSADYLQAETARPVVPGVTTTRNVTLVPVLLNYRWNLGGTPWYIGAGAGIIWAEEEIVEMDLSSDLNFAWQLFAGYAFSRNWFVEGRWLAGNSPGDDGMLIAQLGYRF